MGEGRMYVVCGDYEEFKKFLREYTEKHTAHAQEFCYVYSSDTLRGVENPHGYFYGRWRHRRDMVDIFTMLKVATRQPNPQLDAVISSWKPRFSE